jgi:hypothetical protein
MSDNKPVQNQVKNPRFCGELIRNLAHQKPPRALVTTENARNIEASGVALREELIKTRHVRTAETIASRGAPVPGLLFTNEMLAIKLAKQNRAVNSFALSPSMTAKLGNTKAALRQVRQNKDQASFSPKGNARTADKNDCTGGIEFNSSTVVVVSIIFT